MVTGATDGIGLETCKFLAEKQNMNIVLVGRSQKLVAAEKQVKMVNPKIKTRIYKIDLAETTEIDAYKKMLDDLKDLDISIFVSNAGCTTIGPFLEHSLEDLKMMHYTNVFAPSTLIKLFQARLQNRYNRGAIVVVSSVQAHTPMPLNQHFAASKGFLRNLGLGVELESRGKLDFLVHSTGNV